MNYILLSLIGIVSTLAYAAMPDRVFVEHVASHSNSKEEATLVEALIHNSLGQLSISEAMNSGEASHVLRSRVIKLGEQYIINIRSISAVGVGRTAELKADSIESLDETVMRLVRKTLSEERSTDTVDDLLTSTEKVRGQSRRGVQGSVFFELGSSVSLGGYDSSNRSAFECWRLGLDFMSNPDNHLIAYIGHSGRFDGPEDLTEVGLGLRHFFVPAISAPYLKFDLGVGSGSRGFQYTSSTMYGPYSYMSTKSISGITAGIGAGYELYRNSGVRFDINIGVSALIRQEVLGLFGIRFGAFFGGNSN